MAANPMLGVQEKKRRFSGFIPAFILQSRTLTLLWAVPVSSLTDTSCIKTEGPACLRSSDPKGFTGV